jgi:hypothetical protein
VKRKSIYLLMFPIRILHENLQGSKSVIVYAIDVNMFLLCQSSVIYYTVTVNWKSQVLVGSLLLFKVY